MSNLTVEEWEAFTAGKTAGMMEAAELLEKLAKKHRQKNGTLSTQDEFVGKVAFLHEMAGYLREKERAK